MAGKDTAAKNKDQPADERGNQASRSCPVAGFGASAGGLEAFTELLQEFPADTGLAIVFIQHLDPKHGSVLTELLSRATRMPVREATDGMKVEPNHIYVIPPNTCICLQDCVVRVEPRPAGTPHMPIDYFFRSLAQQRGGKAIGVVLSGTASDGTLGLKAIKAEGGLTFAQDPETAKYDGMPRSAIAANCVDSVLPVKAIAAEIVRLCNHPYLNHALPAQEPAADEPDLSEIFALLRSAKGVDFTYYKPGTIRRRTLRRMALHKIEKPEQYVRYLREHRNELDLLFQDILINVTGFFRESATFSAITTHVLPAILRRRAPDDAVRVWVPGCSTGEDAYSVAICLLEHMRQMSMEVPIQIFGTDLSEPALETARAGLYPESIAADVSPERLRRFFVPSNGMYQIARSVRDTCVFARQNVAKDPPFSKLDLIMCRNVLIYLGPALQIKVMRIFHYALKSTGYLVLGNSESIGAATDFFAPVDRQHKVYSRKAAPDTVTDFGTYEEFEARQAFKRTAEAGAAQARSERIDQILLSRYSPPAVVVDKNLRILQFRGDTTRYLGHQPGEASLDLSRLTPASVGVEIRKRVQDSDARGTPVRSEPVSMPWMGGHRSVTLQIVPIHTEPEPQFLVVFEPAPEGKERRETKPEGEPKGAGAGKRVKDLEHELTTTRQYLQSVIEEQEAATEELKSAHEELQSSNEELQSTNEELLTAKEELQSTNEELTTVNEEMQSRNAELQLANNDLINLLSSVNIPIVMLGNDLRIRKFTPQAEKLLSLIPADVGRPVSDFRLKINVPDLVKLCQEVIDTLTPREREVQDADERIYSMWVRPYRTADNRIEGVVLALLDITERKQAAEARYRRLFEAAKDGIVIADAETGEIVDSNPFIAQRFGYARSELIGVKFWESPLFRDSGIDEPLRTKLRERDSVEKSLALPAQSGEIFHVDVVASLYGEADRKVIQFNIRDISERRRSESRQFRIQEDTRQSQKLEAVGRLAGGVAHDFNNILTAVLGYADLLQQELGERHPARPMAEQIRAGAERAASLTRQLLAFGRKQILTPVVLDLNEVVTETRQMASVMLRDNIDLEMELAPDAGKVRADRTQLGQVVLNLVLNARDAMPGGGRITVNTMNFDVDQQFAEHHPAIPVGQYVAVTVKDTGSGMDEQAKAHLFEPFYTTKPVGSGTGLGLATAYSIVKDSGGYIWAYSELGVGSTFTVCLPRVEKEAAPGEEAPAPAEEAGGTETVLLVEDENAVRTLTRRFLEARGYKVLEAPNGPEALRVSRQTQERIHLLLTDVVMPRMSGREVALQLASERPDMKVLYMSGHTEDTISHHGVLQQGIAFLQKPFTQKVLTRKVRQVLDSEKGHGDEK